MSRSSLADSKAGSIALQTRGAKGEQALHEIVIVGGGAGGLELATRLGETLGKRKRARITLVEKSRTHLWKPLLHAIAAGSMDPSEEELNYLAQAHWRHFDYKFGEMIGLDRAAKEVRLAATYDEDGREITPLRSVRCDTLVMAVGSVTNDVCDSARNGGAGCPVQSASGKCLHPGADTGRADKAWSVARCNHRRRRDRHRACGGTSPHRARSRCARSGPHRPGSGHQDHTP